MRQINKLAAVLLCATLTLPGLTPMGVKAAENPTMQFSTENAKAKETLSLRVKGENTPNFKYGEAKKLELTLKNSGEEEIQNITIVPKVTTGIKNWPFEIEKVSYEQEIASIKGKESVDVVFSVTPRQNVESKYYKVLFDVSYGEKTFEQSVFVKMEGKPKEEKPSQDPDKNPDGNQNGTGGDVNNYPPVDMGGDLPPIDVGGSDGGSGETSATALTPRVIVTGFSTDPAEVKAGTNFKLILNYSRNSI